MCIFCAAVPMTVSLGIATNARQHEHEKQKVAPFRRVLRLKPVFAAIVIGLVLCAVAYHTAIAPRIGFW
jgi:hypothetical protein